MTTCKKQNPSRDYLIVEVNLRSCIAIWTRTDQLVAQVIWAPPVSSRCTLGHLRAGSSSKPEPFDTCTGHLLALPYSIIIGLLHVLGSHNISGPACPKSLIALDRLRIHGGVRARFAWVARRFALLWLHQNGFNQHLGPGKV